MTSPGPDLPGEDLPLLPGEALAGRVLQDLALGAALWVVGTAVLCGALASVGLWTPAVVLPLEAALAAGCGWLAHAVPARPMPVWSAGLLLAVTLGGLFWTAATHSEQLLPRRDSGSYLQSAIWLADTHRRVVPVDPSSVGGAAVLRQPGVTLASPAFYQVGSAAHPAVQPQFVIGPAAVYSLGRWLGGIPTMLVLPALVMAFGTLATGLLTGAVVGPRWAPLGAAGTLAAFPLLHVARSTYSEPLAVLTLAAGLLSLTVAARRGLPDAVVRRSAALAGLLVGATVLVRVDGLRETVLLLPVAALYAVSRRPAARLVRPLLVGAGAGTAVAGVVAGALSYRYLGSIAGSLLPLAALGVVLALGMWAVVAAGRRGVRVPDRARRLVPGALAALTVLVGLGLASRPWWQVVRQSAADPGARVVAGLQLRQGLVVDGGRTYAERSVGWLSWWTGPVALGIALLVLAVAVRRVASAWAGEGHPPTWTGPLLVASGSTLLTLYRPGITPDHPWADRRLVVALPFVVVLVVAAAAQVLRWSLRRLPLPWVVLATLAVTAALLVPEGLATAPHAGERVELGSMAAVDSVCRALRPGDVVLAVDGRAANEWPQVVRGMCGRPALSLTAAAYQDPASLRASVTVVAAGVGEHGGRLVLLAADSAEALRTAGAGDVRQVADVMVQEDARLLERRPDSLVPLPIQVWLGNAASRSPTRP